MSFDFIRHWNIFPYLNRVISDSPLVSLDISLEINSRHESKGMSRRSSIPQFKYGVEVLATRRVEDPRENIALEPSHPRLTPRFVGCQILQLDSLHESKEMSRGCVDAVSATQVRRPGPRVADEVRLTRRARLLEEVNNRTQFPRLCLCCSRIDNT